MQRVCHAWEYVSRVSLSARMAPKGPSDALLKEVSSSKGGQPLALFLFPVSCAFHLDSVETVLQ